MKREEPQFLDKVADNTHYDPVCIDTSAENDAEDNPEVLEAEQKLFLHNIEVADKMHDVELDLSATDLGLED